MSGGAPPIDALVETVRRSLAREYGIQASGVAAIDEQQRVYSTTWVIEINAADQKLRCILKWMRFGAARERELAHVAREVFRNDPWVRTPRIACTPTPHTFLVEALPGRPLDATGAWLPSWRTSLRRAGTWLKRFHAATANEEQVAGEGLLHYVRNRQRGLDALPVPLAERLLDGIAALPTHVGVRVHGDFTPHNVLVDGNGIAVLDQAGIEEFDRGSPWFDVACMMAGLERTWRARSYNPLRRWDRPVDEAVGAFLDSYGARGDEPELRVCRAVRYFTVVYTELLKKKAAPTVYAWAIEALRSTLRDGE